MAKSILLVFLWLASLMHTQAQADGPVKWAFSAVPGEKSDEIKVVITAQLATGWHLYSQKLESGGPMPTKVSFGRSDDFVLIGNTTEEGKLESVYSPAFDMNTLYYSNAVSFVQIVRLQKPAATITGKVDFMLCTKERCMLPTSVPFTLTSNTGG
jgi:DsbC/DsbD-like thiol-disulfide interchange protein